MRPPGKVDAQVRARIVELGKAGKSHRQIEAVLAAEGVELSHRSVGAVLLKAKQDEEAAKAKRKEGRGAGGAVRGGRAGDRRAGSAGGGTGEREEGGEDGAEGAELGPMPPLPDDASDLARLLWDHARVARETAETLRKKTLTEPTAAPAWKHADHAARMWIEQLSAVLPKPKPDPSKDPNNIGAREATHTRVLRMVELAEARLGRLCPRCLGEVGRC